MDTSHTQETRWQSLTEWPLIGLAVVFLAAYASPIVEPDLSATTVEMLGTVQAIIWAAFAADLLVRLILSDARKRFLRRNWFDVAVVLLPVLRPLRALRAAALVSVLLHRTENSLRARVAINTSGFAAIALLLAGLAVTDAERTAGGNIKDVGDGWWWALTTMTTVGYGDRFPVSTTGRVIGVALMLTGIALLGVVSASIASWFIERFARNENAIEMELGSVVSKFEDQLRSLQVQLDRIEAKIRNESAGLP